MVVVGAGAEVELGEYLAGVPAVRVLDAQVTGIGKDAFSPFCHRNAVVRRNLVLTRYRDSDGTASLLKIFFQ